jgi:hypothetical protein
MSTSTQAATSVSVKTLVCAYNDLNQLVSSAPTYDLSLTLNTKYNVLPNVSPASGKVTKLNYFGIGIQGYKNTDNNQGSAPYSPSPADMDLYSPIPFRVVPTTNDLDSTTRANYRLRVKKTINGIDYWCYYLKCIASTTGVELIETNLSTSVDTIITSFDASNLTPTPTTTSTTSSVSYSKQRVVRADQALTLLGSEAIEACTILYGDATIASRVSEIGLYSGLDTPNTGSDNVSYTEVIAAQLAYKRCSTALDLSDPATILTKIVKLSSASAYFI